MIWLCLQTLIGKKNGLIIKGKTLIAALYKDTNSLMHESQMFTTFTST